MEHVFSRLLRFLAYWIAPIVVLLVIAFSEKYRVGGYIAFAALFLFHLFRGRDYRGNPTLFGIRRDNSVWGKQRPAKESD